MIIHIHKYIGHQLYYFASAVKAVSFTGGTATGATVATVAAPHFKKISLELGGKNPSIILPDADLGVYLIIFLLILRVSMSPGTD